MIPLNSFAHLACALHIAVCISGCSNGTPPLAERPNPKASGPKLKTTDDITEYKVEEGQEVVDSKVEITNPITGALEAYEPIKQKIAQDIQIQHAVRIFEATEGRYPKDFEEFMDKVIKANNIRLPQLGPDKQYQYDVQNHKLMVVRPVKAK